MLSALRPALVLLGLFTLLTGAIYPATMTAIGTLAFAHQARGSFIEKDGKALGSSLIGQPFDDPKFLWGRLSGTAPAYNAGASSGTNYGPLNPALADAAKARIEALRALDPGNNAPIPVDLVTASGSGLDPHISPKAAEYQVARIARARGISEQAVRRAIAGNTHGRTLGILGEPSVHVLLVNLALEATGASAH
jgi:K+-transporting ATPase ATPase C chain